MTKNTGLGMYAEEMCGGRRRLELEKNGRQEGVDNELPASRNIPRIAFHPQSKVLVGDGLSQQDGVKSLKNDGNHTSKEFIERDTHCHRCDRVHVRHTFKVTAKSKSCAPRS